MKRDMDVIRKIILTVKEKEFNSEPDAWEKDNCIRSAEGVPEDVFKYHTMLLKEAGLVKAIVGGGDPIPSEAVILDLTWEGHDFADSISNDTVWDTAKGRVQKVGSWTFDLLVECLKQEAKKRIGLVISG